MTKQAFYFEYGETETDYLKSKDPRLAEAIERIGHILTKKGRPFWV